jgi:hypothetical protein
LQRWRWTDHKQESRDLKGKVSLFKDCLPDKPIPRVALSEEDLLPVIAAGDNMVDQAFSVDSGMARHGKEIIELLDLGKSDKDSRQ